MRSIIHFRLNSFCASLEQMKDPGLIGKPVVVTHKSGSGEFVMSASPEAIRQGVCESMTARHAGRYCPNAAFLRADWDTYHDASDAVMDIMSDYSPLLEPHAIDRAYMDVTGCTVIYGSPGSIATEVQRRVEETLGLTISAGIAQNKLLASAASSTAESGICLEIQPGSEPEFLCLLPVSCLWGVGDKIEKRLLNLGVRTVGDLSRIPEKLLVRQFGPFGSKLHRLAQGMDFSPVAAAYPPQVIIGEQMFDDIEGIREPDLIDPFLQHICDRLSAKLQKRSQQAAGLEIRLETVSKDGRGEVLPLPLAGEGRGEGKISTEQGPPLSTIRRTYTFKSPISSAHDIYVCARRIIWSQMPGREVRALQVILTDLSCGDALQLALDGNAERTKRLHAALDNIRSRFGDKAVVYAYACY